MLATISHVLTGLYLTMGFIITALAFLGVCQLAAWALDLLFDL